MNGIELIAEERARQISAEGYNTAHDDKHAAGEMSMAAACYADAASGITRGAKPEELYSTYVDDPGSYLTWPWDEESLKLSPLPIRNLAKAGALIAAEIDRLQRKAQGK